MLNAKLVSRECNEIKRSWSNRRSVQWNKNNRSRQCERWKAKKTNILLSPYNCVCVCVCVSERERETVWRKTIESLDKILLQKYFILCLWKRMLWMFVWWRCLYIPLTSMVSHHALRVYTVFYVRTILLFFLNLPSTKRRSGQQLFSKTHQLPNKPKHTCKYEAQMFMNTLHTSRSRPSYLNP